MEFQSVTLYGDGAIMPGSAMAQSQAESVYDRVVRPWWAKMGLGGILLIIAVFTWNDFAKLESGERESMSVGRSTAFLYDIGGKPLAAGVPLLFGVGFIAWGTVQLARGKEQVTRWPPTPAPNQTDDSEPVEEMSYFYALYHTFWKLIFFVFGVLHMALAIGIVKLIWPDPVGYAYGVAILLAVPVAYVSLEWLARRLGLEEGPIIDWHARSTYVLIVGYGLALALVATLTAHETSGRAASRIREEQNEREKAQMREIRNSPNFKAAEKYLNDRQQQQEQQKR